MNIETDILISKPSAQQLYAIIKRAQSAGALEKLPDDAQKEIGSHLEQIEELHEAQSAQRFYQSAAVDEHHCDGELEVDDNAIVSDSEDGAYVESWVWVSACSVSEAPPCSDDECETCTNKEEQAA